MLSLLWLEVRKLYLVELHILTTRALRALQNPELFTSQHYKQAALAVGAGIAIRLLVAIPIWGIKVLLYFLSFFISFDGVTWDDSLVSGLDFIQNHVLQIPFFLMMLMRHVTPTLDDMFMDSLAWVDKTNLQKHNGDYSYIYYPTMHSYTKGKKDGSANTKSTAEALTIMAIRLGKKAGISLAVLALSYIPYIGRLVLPAASFYTFNKAVGLGPSAIIFGTGIFLPKRYIVIFLQSYFTSRSLMRELLEPYFSRIHFTAEQKKRWFHDREGLLFGFGVGFYIFLRIPLLGVLIYGIAEASTAYLITKVTDPPPTPAKSEGFAESQQVWRNKHEFLTRDLLQLDIHAPAPEAQNPVAATATSSGINLKPQPLGMTGGVPSGSPPTYNESELKSR